MKRNFRKLVFLCSAIFAFTFAQAQTSEIVDSVAVNGKCGMCKKSIEKSAMEAGATTATWDRKSKVLNVKYDASKTNMHKIEQKVAEKGYDTENVKATDEAYSKLEDCCLYDRKILKPIKEQ